MFILGLELAEAQRFLCVHLRLLRLVGLAALPLCKQLEYLQQFWLDSPWEKLCGSLGRQAWCLELQDGGFIPRQVFVPKMG